MRCAAMVCLMLAAVAGPALGQDMVLGRQVQARSDAPSVATTTHARANFVLHCAGCHGLAGAGSRSGNVPDMRRLGEFLRVPGGREFMIKVPGVMGSGLDDAQVAEVTNWVLARLAADSVPAGHVPFSAEEVARARRAPLADVAAERARLVGAAQRIGVSIE